jgi:SNF2 family DNA or RNA helicase
MIKYKFKTKPYEHQIIALQQSWNKKEYAWFMEMGTGKTKVAIDNIGILNQQNLIDTAIIVAPKSVYLNWEDEIANHLSSEIPYSIYSWNKSKKDIDTKNLKVYLINTEALSHKSGVLFVKEIFRKIQRKYFYSRRKYNNKKPISSANKIHFEIVEIIQIQKDINRITSNKISIRFIYTMCFLKSRPIRLF